MTAGLENRSPTDRLVSGLSAAMWRHSRKVKGVVDLGVWALAIVVAFVLRLETGPGGWYQEAGALVLVAAPTMLLTTAEFRLARQSWAHFGLHDLRRLAAAVTVTTLALFLLASIIQELAPLSVPRSVPLLAGAFAFLLLGGARLGVRLLHDGALLSRPGGAAGGVLILGAGDVGVTLARELRRTGRVVPVGFVDGDPTRHGMDFEGVPVLGGLAELAAIARQTGATTLFLAQPGLREEDRRPILRAADGLGLEVRTVPGMDDLLSESPRQIRSVMRSFVGNGVARNVLVIGGAGYIGSALVPLLLERGFQVRVLDSMMYGRGPLAAVLGHERLEVLEGDFRNVDSLVEAMQGIDTVVHLGAIVGDPACDLDEDLTIETNLMATKMVAEIAKGFGITRFVFASTCSVYGMSDDILDESSPVRPASLYARTKLASEKVLAAMATESFRPVILRFATVYGFSGRTRFDLVVNLLTAKAYRDGAITLHGGDQWRPFVHVADLGRAVLKTVQTPIDRLHHTVYNVGSEEQNLTLRQLAERILGHVPDARIEELGSGRDHRNYRVGFARIRLDMGFVPAFSVDDGIQQVLDALRSGSITDMHAPEHSNVHSLTEGGLSRIVRRVYGSVLDTLEEETQAPPVKLRERPPRP